MLISFEILFECLVTVVWIGNLELTVHNAAMGLVNTMVKVMIKKEGRGQTTVVASSWANRPEPLGPANYEL